MSSSQRQLSPPRRRRLKQNRNPEAGMRNRQKGLFKKAHTWYRYYGGDVLIFIRRPDGRLAGYESRPGLLPEFAKLSVPAHDTMGPDDFDTINERSTTPITTSQSESDLAQTSSRSSTPRSFSSENPCELAFSTFHHPVTPKSLPVHTTCTATSSSPASMPPAPSPSPSPLQKKSRKMSASQSRAIPIGLRRAVLSFDTSMGKDNS